MSTRRLVCVCALAAACLIPNTSWAQNKRLLLIVPKAQLSRSDRLRAALFSSWGYRVSLLEQAASQAAIDDAADNNDVAFVSAECDDKNVQDKLKTNPIGVVTDNYNVCEELGFARGVSRRRLSSPAVINSGAHEITASFPPNRPLPDLLGNGLIYVAQQPAISAVALSSFEGAAHFMAIEKGKLLADGGYAPGRRVLTGHLNVDRVNRDVALIVQRAIEWAAAPIAYEYFVTPQGNDRNSGRTLADPFRTVTHAALVASAGDTVHVGVGTYTGDVNVVNGGRRGRQLAFIADVEGQRTRTAPGVVTLRTSNTHKGAAIKMVGRRDVRFARFVVNQGAVLASFEDSKRCVIESCYLHNAADDGVLCMGSEVLVTGSQIRSARDNGVVVSAQGRLKLVDSQVESNRNCGVRVLSGNAEVQACDLKANRYGVRAERETIVRIDDANVERNQYGVYCSGEQANLAISRCQIRENTIRGVHLAGKGTVVQLDRCQIFGNRNDGVYLHDVQAIMTNCLVHHNQADGVELVKCDAELTNLTVAYNKRDGVRANSSSGSILNTISAFNTRTGLAISKSPKLQPDYNLIYGNRTDYSGSPAAEHDVAADPAFVDGPGGDFLLTLNSSAVDAGTVVQDAFDLLNIARPKGNGFDVGCHEHPTAKRVRIFEWKEVR